MNQSKCQKSKSHPNREDCKSKFFYNYFMLLNSKRKKEIKKKYTKRNWKRKQNPIERKD